MRDVTFDPSLSRSIAARLRIDDERVRFSSVLTSETYTNSYYDAEDYNSGILRVIQEGTRLYSQYVQDGVFPAWVYIVSGVGSTDKPALFGNKLFYRNVGAHIVTRTFDGAAWSAETDTGVVVNSFCAVAPVSATEFYVLDKLATESSAYRYVHRLRYWNGSTLSTWDGRFYNSDTRFFDAVRVNSADYIYAYEQNGRGVYLKKVGNNWGTLQPLIPMDVIDDIFSYHPNLVSVINGKVWITGVMTRGETMVPLHIYMQGPEQPTLGRDMFIWKGSPGRTAVGGRKISYASEPLIGKLHLVGNEIWYLGPKILSRAPATSIFGVDNPAKMLTAGPVNVRLGAMSNQPFLLTADLPGNLTHAALKAGARAVLDVCTNDIWKTIGTFSIDALVKPRDGNGRTQTLVARSAAAKKLAQWESDAPFDYWSQTKQSSNPADMSEVVRIRGMWKDYDNTLGMERLNEDGFMYLTAKSCRNGEVRGHFQKVAGNFGIRFGVGLNYWVEGKYEAAARLKVDAYQVKDEQLLNNGIFAVYGTTEVNSAPGIKLYQVVGNVFQPLTNGAGTALQASVDFGSGTYYWLQMSFNEGRVKVMYRSGTTWTTAIDDVPKFYGETMPWMQDQTGRAAFYAKNVTPNSLCAPFSSTDRKIYLDDITGFPTSDTLIVDGEQIAYDGKSALSTRLSSTTVAPDRLMTAAQTGSGGEWAYIGRLDTSMWCRRKLDGLGWPAAPNALYVEVRITKFGDPQYDLVLGLYKNDATAGAPLGTPVEAFTIPRTMVNTNGMMSTIGFFLSKEYALTANNFNVVLSSNTAAADANNYYAMYVYSNAAATTNLASYYNKTTNTWVASGSVYEPQIFCYGMSTLPSIWSNKQVVCVSYVSGFNIGTTFKDEAGSEYTILDKDEDFSRTYMLLDRPYQQAGSPHTFSVLPYLTITQRGINGTLPASHARTTVSVYKPVPCFKCDRVEYYSSDLDLTLEEIVSEIARKSGVETTFADDELVPEPLAPNVGVTIPRGDVVVKCTLPSLTGTVVLEPWKLSQGTAGIQFTISSSSIAYGVRETFTLAAPMVGDITASFFEDSASFWCNGNFIHTFRLVDADLLAARMSSVVTQMYLGISGTETAPITFHIPESSMRIDNYILDNGRKGADLVNSLIGEKHFFYQDTADGSLRLFRDRTVVNEGAPFRLVVSAQDREEDAPGATWIRVEGGEIYEAFDDAKIAEYGMIFHLAHANEVNSMYEAIQQADYVLDDYASQYNTRSLEGEADFRVEPNDLIYYETDEGIEQIIVDSVDYEISVEGENARCAMTIQGRVP